MKPEQLPKTTPPVPANAAEPRRELTVRAVATAMVVAVIVGASYPYVVLKIGYGPNISVVSAFFGYIALSVLAFFTGVRGTRWENNIVQTAGTAAGEAGFMCVVLAAMDMLRNKFGRTVFPLDLNSWQIFLWLSVAGLIGVLLAVPLRKHYIDDEKLPFADGTAAGETMLVLDLDPKEARSRVRALYLGLVSSALVAFVRDFHWKKILPLLPGEVAFGESGKALRMGSEVSLLSFGSGLLVGLRITLSMGLGMVIAWVLAPPILTGQVPALVAAKIVPAQTYGDVLRWVMWPATGLMLAGGLTGLVLKWKVISKSFSGFSTRDLETRQSEFPMSIVIWGALSLSVALCLLQKAMLGFPIWLTIVSLLLSVPLLLVGTRVLGETNWAPISAMANVMQAVFAVLSPGHMVNNVIGSGMSGSVAAHGEHLMQDYRAGQIVGANYRHLTIVQLMAVPVGAASVAIAYPALKARYGIGGDTGLSSPVSVKWAGFAELLNEGLSKLPHGCFTAMVVALFLGILLTVLEPRWGKYVPSPTGVGLGMLIPGYAIMPMVVGGVASHLWHRTNPKHEEAYNTPLASGFIAGEALLVLVFSILAMFGVAV